MLKWACWHNNYVGFTVQCFKIKNIAWDKENRVVVLELISNLSFNIQHPAAAAELKKIAVSAVSDVLTTCLSHHVPLLTSSSSHSPMHTSLSLLHTLFPYIHIWKYIFVSLLFLKSPARAHTLLECQNDFQLKIVIQWKHVI